MTDSAPPTMAARAALYVVTLLGLLSGLVVLTMMAFLGVYGGVPVWWVTVAVVAVLIGGLVAFQRARRAPDHR